MRIIILYLLYRNWTATVAYRYIQEISKTASADLFDGVIDRLQRLKPLGVQQVSESDLHWRHLTSVLQQPLLVWVRSKVPACSSESHNSYQAY